MFCPLVNKNLECDECFLTALVAEGEAPKSEAVEGALDKESFESICMNCP